MEESETLELKRTTSELKEGIISIAAILNKHGHGELYFGVTDEGEVLGQDVTAQTLRRVRQTISQKLKPQAHHDIKQVSIEGRTCIRVAFRGDGHQEDALQGARDHIRASGGHLLHSLHTEDCGENCGETCGASPQSQTEEDNGLREENMGK